MEKQHTNKQVIQSMGYPKHTKAGTEDVNKIINENKCDFFLKEHGSCDIDGDIMDFAVITMYYPSTQYKKK